MYHVRCVGGVVILPSSTKKRDRHASVTGPGTLCPARTPTPTAPPDSPGAGPVPPGRGPWPPPPRPRRGTAICPTQTVLAGPPGTCPADVAPSGRTAPGNNLFFGLIQVSVRPKLLLRLLQYRGKPGPPTWSTPSVGHTGAMIGLPARALTGSASLGPGREALGVPPQTLPGRRRGAESRWATTGCVPDLVRSVNPRLMVRRTSCAGATSSLYEGDACLIWTSLGRRCGMVWCR